MSSKKNQKDANSKKKQKKKEKYTWPGRVPFICLANVLGEGVCRPSGLSGPCPAARQAADQKRIQPRSGVYVLTCSSPFRPLQGSFDDSKLLKLMFDLVLMLAAIVEAKRVS